RGPGELVDGGDALEAITAGGEDGCIAGEARGVAGDAHHRPHLAAGDFTRLRFGTGSRRIEDDSVMGIQFGRRQRVTEEVAAEAGDRLQPPGVAYRLLEGGDGAAVAVGGEDAGLLGQAEGEGADAA